MAEKSTGKPFNPLLFETFEFKTDKIAFLAEQVSHHPPVAAIYCRGKHWTMTNNHKINISFNGKNILANHEFRTYVIMDNFDETYEVHAPTISIHNLIIGNLYADIGDTLTVINTKRPMERADVHFTRRSWFSDEAYIFQGEAFIQEGKNKIVQQRITGQWNSQVTLTDEQTKVSTQVWTKVPYPEKSEWQYGMSHFHLQMNYFPKRLQ